MSQPLEELLKKISPSVKEAADIKYKLLSQMIGEISEINNEIAVREGEDLCDFVSSLSGRDIINIQSLRLILGLGKSNLKSKKATLRYYNKMLEAFNSLNAEELKCFPSDIIDIVTRDLKEREFDYYPEDEKRYVFRM